MSFLWTIVVALLAGLVIYRSFYTLVKSVRLLVACVFMAAFIVIVQNMESVGHIWKSAGALHFPFFAQGQTGDVLNPDKHPDPLTDLAFQSIIRDDQNFLDAFTQTQSQTAQPPGIPTPLQIPGIAKVLADNSLRVKRAELVPPKETVKRAQLVTQNEASKHAELVRSGQR